MPNTRPKNTTVDAFPGDIAAIWTHWSLRSTHAWNNRLYHHNQDRTDDEINSIIEKCNAVLGERKIEMECCGIRQGCTVII